MKYLCNIEQSKMLAITHARQQCDWYPDHLNSTTTTKQDACGAKEEGLYPENPGE